MSTADPSAANPSGGADTGETGPGPSDAWVPGSVADPFAADLARSAGGGRRRRGVRLGLIAAGAALAVGTVSVGAYAAYEKFIGGGGPQPESALPSTAVAFAKVDLDPSGPQKISAIRFARKLPKVPVEGTKDDADLRQVVFDQIQKSGGLSGLDYAKDVRPWLGNRFGVAVLPGPGDQAAVVVALAVTDQSKAKAGLSKAGEDAHCSVGAAFALCSDTQSVVDAAVSAASKSTLADAPAFSADMKVLGEDGIASFWSNLSEAKKIAATTPSILGISGGSTSSVSGGSGRVAGALRFDGADLEIVGRVTALTDPPKTATGTGIERLPEGSLVGIGLAGGDALAEQAVAALTAAGSPLASGLDEFTRESGITLPDDLAALLGSQTSVAFGGLDDGGQPNLALLTTSARNDVQRIVDKLDEAGLSSPTGTPLSVTGVDGRTVVALSDSYAASVAKHTGLGQSDAFKAAVPDAAKAQLAAYVDIAGLVSSMGQDMSDADRADIAAFRALGLSVGRDGKDATFRLRLVTK